MNTHKFGIKYPFTYQNDNNLFLDLNNTVDDGLLSEILHVVLTPKGQRIRMPNFGTNLIKYIFEQNDEQTWENVKSEIINSVASFIPSAKLNDIRVLKSESDDNRVMLYLEYSVSKGKTVENNKVMIEL